MGIEVMDMMGLHMSQPPLPYTQEMGSQDCILDMGTSMFQIYHFNGAHFLELQGVLLVPMDHVHYLLILFIRLMEVPVQQRLNQQPMEGDP
jgi:hypothetical protein